MIVAESIMLIALLAPGQAPDLQIPGEPVAPPDSQGYFAPEAFSPVGEDISIINPPPDYECRRWNLFYYFRHNLHHGVTDRHHRRYWTYLDGQHHGYPYGSSTYAPRAEGASYTFGQWVPRRSYYYAYEPGGMWGDYGRTVEPYYAPRP